MTSLKDIKIIPSWPGAGIRAKDKAPLRIAYPFENARIDSVKWGSEVNHSMNGYSWPKLLLDSGSALTEHDNRAVVNVTEIGILPLPSTKDATEACGDYLKQVYDYMIRQLEAKIDQSTLRRTKIEC